MNLDKLKGVIPESVLAQLPDTCAKFNINTPLRLAHFLAQCDYESCGFKLTVENLNYSSDALKTVFGKYFTAKEIVIYARQPEKIANRVYALRLGNGVEASGDGWKYRGRGFIQLTGRNNYTLFAKSVSDDEVITDPKVVATKYPLASAAFFFESSHLWKWCDVGSSDEAVTDVTKRVNGGTNGLNDRISKFKKYWELLKCMGDK